MIERIKIESQLVDDNPNMQDDDHKWSMTHWRCVLRFEGRRLTVPFSMGEAHTGEPEAADVVSCLCSDSCGYDNARDFEDWASEYGYDTDSRKAERTYKIIGQQRNKLRRFLGEHFEAVCNEVAEL